MASSLVGRLKKGFGSLIFYSLPQATRLKEIPLEARE
jgi:hypothetical protein